jgi:beta-glucosidase
MKKLALLICVLAVSFNASAQQPKISPELDARIDSIVSKMTLEEKVDYIGGTGFAIRAVPRLGLPALEMSDGPIGVRSNSRFPSTAYAAGIGLAASWNRDLAQKVGEGIGKDARARGVHFMLGPGVNIYRYPTNGRNFEYFGEDPFLSGAIAANYIIGMQKEGVSSTVKHFLGNNSEFDRHNTDSIIDERTLREIYLPVFEAAVRQAHVGAIMDSYNFVNGTHLTQNGYFNVDVIRKDWGFDGVMMSDWLATYDGVAAANNGLDLEMPTGAFMNRKNLLPAVADGRVKEFTLDEKVRHILNTAARFGWLDHPQTDLSLSTYDEANQKVALEGARESIVLLKNENRLLPLDPAKIKSVLVVGPDAYPAQPVAGGSAAVLAFAPVSILEGLSKFLGSKATVFYQRGLPTIQQLAQSTEFTTDDGSQRGLKMESFDNVDLSGPPSSTEIVRHVNRAGHTWEDIDFETFMARRESASSRRFAGDYVAKEAGEYVVASQGSVEGAGHRVSIDGKVVIDNWKAAYALQPHATVQLTAGPHQVVIEDFQNGFVGGRLRVGIAPLDKLVNEDAKKQAAAVDAVIVAAGFDRDNESEGADRTFDLPFGQDELIREMAAANPKTIVAVTSGGNTDSTGWLPHVPAYLELWFPGEAGGTALAEILFGAVNPSGRLPVTFEKRREDNPTFNSYYPKDDSNRVVYSEGIFVGYRGYEHNKVEPLFPFGYGLSYTTFKFSNLAVKDLSTTSVPKYEVSFDVTNTGKRAGAEVAEVYVSDTHSSVPRPPKELKGFAKVTLNPGESKKVTVPLDTRSLAYYDVAGKEWRAEAGTFGILVGDSSQNIELKGELRLATTATTK